MATRRSFLLGLGMGLFSAASVWADPPGIVSMRGTASEAVDTVRRYLGYRATNEWTKAYALLSPSTQAQIPFDRFTMINAFPASLTGNGVSPALTAISALFFDAGDTLGYQYQVIGIAPEDLHLVLVSAQPHPAGGTTDTKPFLLRIATTPNPQTRLPCIDRMLSYQQTDAVGADKMQERARLTTSISNLKQISLAMLQCVQDNDVKYPVAERWVDAITPYLVGTSGTHAQREQTLASLFHDPSAPDSQKWSYAFNSSLSGLSLAQIDSPATTVMLFESNAGVKNASDTGESIPHPGRHSGGTDYALTDGHVKWFSDTMPDADRAKFLSFSPNG